MVAWDDKQYHKLKFQRLINRHTTKFTGVYLTNNRNFYIEKKEHFLMCKCNYDEGESNEKKNICM